MTGLFHNGVPRHTDTNGLTLCGKHFGQNETTSPGIARKDHAVGEGSKPVAPVEPAVATQPARVVVFPSKLAPHTAIE
jgi:hypothetical protein